MRAAESKYENEDNDKRIKRCQVCMWRYTFTHASERIWLKHWTLTVLWNPTRNLDRSYIYLFEIELFPADVTLRGEDDDHGHVKDVSAQQK